MLSHLCDCGRRCKSPAGLKAHQRSCRIHIDAEVAGTMQLELLPASGPERGFVERAALRDLSNLESADQLGDAVEALTAAYVLLGRELDRAEVQHDRWGKINTARQLQAVRRELAPTAADVDAGDIGAFFDQLNAAGGDLS